MFFEILGSNVQRVRTDRVQLVQVVEGLGACSPRNYNKPFPAFWAVSHPAFDLLFLRFK